MNETENSRLEELRSVPLFAELDGAQLQQIAESATELTVRAGQVLVQPNAHGAGMFILQEGQVEVELPGARTVELGAGEFFGELALLVPDALRSARVCAKTPVHCLAVDRRSFERMLELEPRIALPMLRVLARRLVTANSR